MRDLEPKAKQDAQASRERRYEAPDVVKHGTVVELTLGMEEKKAEKFAVFDGVVNW